MPAWSLVNGGESDAAIAEWFGARFARARALMTAAGVSTDNNFDTIIAEDFQQTITSQLVDVVGVADANPVNFYNGGVVEAVVGDDAVSPSSARLQLTDPPSHVGDLVGKSWYAAALVRLVRPPDGELGDTACDAIGLFGDIDNRVGLGILGNASGGSVTNWVGYAVSGAGFTSKLGPLLGDGETAKWRLYEMWHHDGALHFYFDGEEFAETIDDADIPAVPATLSMVFQRDDVGEVVQPQFDKVCVIVRSPVIGEAS